MVRGNEQLPKAGAACGRVCASGGQSAIGDPPIAGRSSDEFAAYAFHRTQAENIHGGCLPQAEFQGGESFTKQLHSFRAVGWRRNAMFCPC